MRKFVRFALLSMSLMLSGNVVAQDVDLTKYPDYSPKTYPNALLMVRKSVMKASGEVSQRPSHVNNADYKFMSPVFNQDGGSCGSASRIRYMFTHELNSYRNLDGTDDANNYPTHFVWLLTNGNSGKDEFVQYVGVPSAATYGGRTYSSLFGNQEEINEDFGWMTGYEKWYEAMHNRMLKPSHFPISVETEEGREAVKNWLWNHNGDTDFHSGGIVGVGVASGGDWQRIPKTAANDAAGVTDKYYVNKWGTSVDHALTIVGYDDRIEFDLNGNGVYGEKSADELGAWIIVNSWGGWCNNGFIYCPYAHAGAWFDSEGKLGSTAWWAPEIYQVRKNYRPLRTIRVKMDYSHRSEMCLSAGVSANLNATEPDRTVAFEHFKYAGDGNSGNTNPAPAVPMLGKWADGRLHDEPMEFGYDLTDLSSSFDINMPLKYFFIIETRSWGIGGGHIYEASIMDYVNEIASLETPFALPQGGYEIKSEGNKTVISTVVYGQGYYAPQNLSYDDGVLVWDAPMKSGREVESYIIYCEGEKIASLSSTTTSYTPVALDGQVEYAVSAMYDDNSVESAKVSVKTPIPATVSGQNKVLKLSKAGLTIPEIFATRYPKATIEFWFKPSSLSNWNQAAGSWGSFMMHANANGAFTAGWNTGAHRVDGTAGDLVVGSMKHVAIVVNGNNLTTYINGVQKGTVTSDTYSGLGGFGDLVLSSDQNNGWNGEIDEIRIWSVARSSTQISSNKNKEFVGARVPDGLIAYYRGETFDRNGVTYLRDYVGSHHAPLAKPANSLVKTSTTPALGKVTTTLQASINEPTESVYVGIPVTLTSTCSESACRTEWSCTAIGVESITAKSATFTFPAQGVYEVTLTAYNSKDESKTATLNVTVEAAPAPDARFTPTTTEVPTSDRVSFIVNNPLLGYQYEWYMPGAVVERANTTHTTAVYDKSGTYSVTLKVSAPDGSKDDTYSTTINVVDVAPVADFQISPAVAVKGSLVNLKDNSKHAPTLWQWMLRSEKKVYSLPEHEGYITLDTPGVYDVTLAASNESGSNSKTQTKALTICNADSKNGLNFGSGQASATATGEFIKTGQTAFTLEWWMNPSILSTYCVGMGESESTMLVKTDADGAMYLSVAGKTIKSGSGFVISGEWHHYAVARYTSSIYFYRDGVQFAKVTLSPSLKAVNSFTMGVADMPMNGMVDEVRLWNRRLSLSQLCQYANGPITDMAAAENDGLVFYYDFNQSSGDVLDRTSHGYDAVRSGFGPDGDAWGLSLGVFSLNFDKSEAGVDITAQHLTNYKKAFASTGSSVNPANSSRFTAISGWNLEGTVKDGVVTTGAHVDSNKNYCFTCTTGWDGFANTLADHRAYQTVTLPAGAYSFTAYYDSTEGECGNSYIAVAEGSTLPVTADLETEALAFTKMKPKASDTESNSVFFFLTKETQVSLGLILNMSGQMCMTIQKFELVKVPVTEIQTENMSDRKFMLTYLVDGETYKEYEVAYGAAIEPEPAPEAREGYTFSGWDNVPATMPGYDVVVRGTFTINKYRLTAYLDEDVYMDTEFEYGAVVSVPVPEVPEGRVFDGWDTEVPETMPAHDVVLHGTTSVDTAIDKIFPDKSERLNVYNVSGQQMLTNVTVETAMRKLSPGIYIANGKRVLVR